MSAICIQSTEEWNCLLFSSWCKRKEKKNMNDATFSEIEANIQTMYTA